MKKFVPIMLIALVSSSLFGCNKGPSVSYTIISEQQYNEYHSDTKVSEAKEKFAEVVTFSFFSYQRVTDFNYDLFRYYDENYYYEYARSITTSSDEISQELYIGGETQDYYSVTADSSSHYNGSEAETRYQDCHTRELNMVNRSIENPIYIASKYSIEGESEYYLGSDNTIKIITKGVEADKYAVTFISAETLWPIRVTVYVGQDTVDNQFGYNNTFIHKSPEDIGYKEV